LLGAELQISQDRKNSRSFYFAAFIR